MPDLSITTLWEGGTKGCLQYGQSSQLEAGSFAGESKLLILK